MMKDDPIVLAQLMSELRIKVLNRDGWKCSICGIGVRGRSHNETMPFIGHSVPRESGGKDELGNLRTLCGKCYTLESARIV